MELPSKRYPSTCNYKLKDSQLQYSQYSVSSLLIINSDTTSIQSTMISTYVLLAAGWTLLSIISRCLFVSGHGHLITPRCRNYFAYEAGRDDTTNSPPGLPPREYCSHCLNAKLATETCGRGAAQSYDPNPVDGWLDTEGNPMPWISQQTYVENQEILVSIELTTNHVSWCFHGIMHIKEVYCHLTLSILSTPYIISGRSCRG